MGFVLFRDHKYLSILQGRSILIKTDFLKGILYELSPRFGHSMVPDKFSSVTRTRSEELQMSETFFSPATMKGAGFMDGLVRGMAQQGSQLWDSSFVEDIRNHLFESSPGRGGLDLVAVNIQVLQANQNTFLIIILGSAARARPRAAGVQQVQGNLHRGEGAGLQRPHEGHGP